MRSSVAGTTVKDVTALVQEELAEVNRCVEEALLPNRPELRALLGHVSGFRGKQLRPALSLLVAKALGGLSSEHIQVGAILEMIHTATLVHDDILDGALIRRKLASLHSVYGHEVSVLVGDYIYARAFQMSVDLPDPRCSRLLSEVTRVICQGEVTQMLHRFDLAFSEEQYYQVIYEKTAILYGAAAELGAFYAGASEDRVKEFRAFGDALGMAFQIIDDILDVTGEEDVVGKSLGTDLDKGKLTLPLIHLYHELDGADRKLFEEMFRDGSREGRQILIAKRFNLQPGINFAEAKADSYLEKALGILAKVHPEQGSSSGSRGDALANSHEALDGLRVLADFVLKRSS
jgi:octaprenyl-diphosphate synthase